MLCLVTLAVAGAAALALSQPWLFPSLGPTVMLLFERPDAPSSRPSAVVVGHLVGIAVGAACLVLFGLTDAPAAPADGVTPAYVGAACLSVAGTALLLQLLRCPHAPAGASTLIVSLGILSSPGELAAMAGAVVLVAAVAWGLNLALGSRPGRRVEDARRGADVIE